ncbi:hypothetical protein SFRURICE_007536, partial [Spodoptera frugiperda]
IIKGGRTRTARVVSGCAKYTDRSSGRRRLLEPSVVDCSSSWVACTQLLEQRMNGYSSSRSRGFKQSLLGWGFTEKYDVTGNAHAVEMTVLSTETCVRSDPVARQLIPSNSSKFCAASNAEEL